MVGGYAGESKEALSAARCMAVHAKTRAAVTKPAVLAAVNLPRRVRGEVSTASTNPRRVLRSPAPVSDVAMALRIVTAVLALVSVGVIVTSVAATSVGAATCTLTVDQRPGFHVLPRKDWVRAWLPLCIGTLGLRRS